eukprot:TRINITY_DN37480_c0_g1_i1.p1 TRINITY_DN37480_c0_g1~~TRINITY_DN37480_c0_g1_i1.p1  ORF type:complete len:175 (+),score=21.74 TRINITY_DN37480_c0_g1_i1:70-525(+)
MGGCFTYLRSRVTLLLPVFITGERPRVKARTQLDAERGGPCPFFMAGSCRKGTACPYSHKDDSAAAVRQFPRRSFDECFAAAPCRKEHAGRECSICLVEFKAGQRIRKSPCQHVFHSKCADAWARKQFELAQGAFSKFTCAQCTAEYEALA